MKIAIIGCPGSGKSTLAARLHKILNIPLYHLDKYFWQPEWVRLDRSQFAKIHRALCDKDSWIIEGMAVRHIDYRIEKANVIIFLDIPLWTCLYRIFKRAIMCYGQMRSSNAEGCPEGLPDLEFLTYIWNFNRKKKPIIKALLEKYKDQKKIFEIRNVTELEELIKKFE
jgi:adenylate kinase family enzyme